jgi:hypothetical protein
MGRDRFHSSGFVYLLLAAILQLRYVLIHWDAIYLVHLDASSVKSDLDTPVSLTTKDNNTVSVAPIEPSFIIRKAKASPTAVYWCGWRDWFTNPYHTNLAQGLFPEVQILAEFNKSLKFSSTDLLIHSCGPQCDGVGPDDVERVFPGKISTFNGESGPHRWWVRTNKRPRVVPLAAVDNLRGGGSRSKLARDAVTLAQIVVSMYPMEWQYKYLFKGRTLENTGTFFLIYASRRCVEHRETAFVLLSTIPNATAHYANQQCYGLKSPLYHTIQQKNMLRAPLVVDNKHWQNNHVLYKNYRFALVMENKYMRGYITEKIVTAFMAGCIPIYYGTMQIFDMFNPRSFIYWNVTHPETSLAQIRYLESNQTAFQEMLNEPILANGMDTVRELFSLRDQIEGGELKWRLRSRLGYGPVRHSKQKELRRGTTER